MTDTVRVCASGDLWVGSGTGSVESAILEVVRCARNRLYITSFSLTSGAASLWSELEQALCRGVAIDFVVNRPEAQIIRTMEQLNVLSSSYPHFRVWGFSGDENTDLHAKVICCDDKVAMLGSSNLSYRGLVTNHELGLLVRGPAAGVLCAKIRELLTHRHVSRVL